MKEWDKIRREEVQRLYGDLKVKKKKAIIDKNLEKRIE